MGLCGDICTESPCSSCHTVSGPDTGSPCIFPFIRNGKPHNSCATNGDGKKWCDTQVGNPNTGWGYCNEDCIPTITRPDLCTQELGLYMCGKDCIEILEP